MPEWVLEWIGTPGVLLAVAVVWWSNRRELHALSVALGARMGALGERVAALEGWIKGSGGGGPKAPPTPAPPSRGNGAAPPGCPRCGPALIPLASAAQEEGPGTGGGEPCSGAT